ncbi:Hypothetical predicted protein [Octopus vulgaris]|uniref:Uncharacterized protein n=1 Tax=Octopus vulgaris TaxID=6645 RepID=A0AA36C0D5_OCTVU|nr:Hypothetical predicted protein [Octopus vulgaris]
MDTETMSRHFGSGGGGGGHEDGIRMTFPHVRPSWGSDSDLADKRNRIAQITFSLLNQAFSVEFLTS